MLPNYSRRAFIAAIGAPLAMLVIPDFAFADSLLACQDLKTCYDGSSLSISENGETYVIDVVETDETRTVTVRNLTTGVVDRFVVDTASGLMYSSYTGNTIDIGSILVEYDNTSISPKLNEPARTYERFEFSWSYIKNATGGVAVLVPIVALLIAGIPGLTSSGKLLAAIEAALNGVGWVIPDDPNHGIYVVMVMKRWYENGKLVKAEYGFDSAGVY